MKKIVIASKNPVKINATLTAFQAMFPEETFSIQGISVPSGVSDQPKSGSETLEGSLNRVNNAYKAEKGADFYVGIEGGIEEKDGDMEVLAWVVIKSHDQNIGKGRTGTFFLPPKIVELIHEGKELGEADDIVFGQNNSKQRNGSVGILTNDVMDRTEYYRDAVILAIIPFRNRELYF